MKIVFQTEAADCGLACIAMVAGHHGHHIELRDLKRKHAVSLRGASIASLLKVFSSVGLEGRGLTLEINDLKHLAMPCILHWDLNHYVVLYKVLRKHIVIGDPANGLRKINLHVASKSFTGAAIEVIPGASFREKRKPRQIEWSMIIGDLRRVRSSLLQVLVLAVSLEAIGVVMPMFSQWILDDVLISSDKDLLLLIFIGMLLLGIIQTACNWTRGYISINLTNTVGLTWINRTFFHLMSLPVSWFERRHLGDIVSRFESVKILQQTLTSGLLSALLDGAMCLVTLCVMAAYSASLSSVAAIAVIFYGLLRWTRYAALRAASAEQIVRSSKQQSYFLESVRGVKTLKLHNRQFDRSRRYMNMAIDSGNAQLDVLRQNLAFSSANNGIVMIENALILYLGALLVISGSLSIGMLVAFLGYKGQFITRACSFIDQFLALRMLSLQSQRFADILLTEPERIDSLSPRSCNFAAGAATLDVRELSFAYGTGERPIFKNASFSIRAGECVAIVGQSGTGKTTLLKIITGQELPTEGGVYINGTKISDIGLYEYRSKIGCVMQDDRLFSGTIAENISFFDECADERDIIAVAKMAAIHEEISAMPMGYQSIIGDMGSSLSGGQQQRILLARALFKKPSILFLDEATSHLDVGTESFINSIISSLKMTRIIVAHRPQTIASADRIIDIKDLTQITRKMPG